MAEESLRDTVAAAFDKASDSATGSPGSEGAPTSAPPPEAPADSTPAPAPAGESGPGYLEPKPAAAPVDRGDGRDPAGRFAPKAPEAAPEATPGGQPPPAGAQPPPKEPTPAEPSQGAWKAPSSWRPAVREHWAKLPPDVQAEVSRREQDMIRQMGEVTPVMNFARTMTQAMTPYSQDIQAVAGGDSVAFNASNAQARHIIFHGEPQQQADFLADLIVNARVNPELLDGALARRMNGAGPAFTPQAPPQPTRTVREEVLEALQQAAQEGLNNEARTEVERFIADPKHEFAGRLRGYMGALIQAAAEDNVTLTLEQAYAAAAAAHPEIGPIVRRRADEERTRTAAEAATAARRAGVSLPSGGAPQGSPGQSAGATLRDTVAAAWDSAAQRAAGR